MSLGTAIPAFLREVAEAYAAIRAHRLQWSDVTELLAAGVGLAEAVAALLHAKDHPIPGLAPAESLRVYRQAIAARAAGVRRAAQLRAAIDRSTPPAAPAATDPSTPLDPPLRLEDPTDAD